MSTEHKFTYISAVPIEASWKLVKKGDELLPKVLPAYFAKVEVLEGDGGAGTTRVVTLGEGNASFTTSSEICTEEHHTASPPQTFNCFKENL